MPQWSASSRPGNPRSEDRFRIERGPWSDSTVALVTDGHGGEDCAVYVADHLPAAVCAADPFPSTAQAVCRCIRDAIVAVDGDYLDRPTAGADTGACLVVTVVHGGSVYVGSVGDCRAVMVRRQCAAPGDVSSIGLALTVDHTTRDLGECARVAQRTRDPRPIRCLPGEDIPRVAGSLAITRSLGDRRLKRGSAVTGAYITGQPVCSAWRLRSDTDRAIILASDGFFDWVTNAEAASVLYAYLSDGGEPSGAAQRLVYFFFLNERVPTAHGIELNSIPVSKRGSFHDDVTVIVGVLDPDDFRDDPIRSSDLLHWEDYDVDNQTASKN